MPYKKSDTETYKLYSLSDSTGIRYIGITQFPLAQRLSGHISSCKQAFKYKKSRHHRHCWIKSLLDKGEKPIIKLLKEYNCKEDVISAEIETIKELSKTCKLVNSTEGGEGLNGYVVPLVNLEKRRHKVDQYSKEGEFITTFKSLSHAALSVTGSKKNNTKISQVTRGKRITAFGYVWRIHGESFDKYKTKGNYKYTEERRKKLSNSKIKDNAMKGKTGLEHPSSRPVVITDLNNVILTITESVKEAVDFTNLSKSCIEKVLKKSQTVSNYRLLYASEDIVQSLQKCKSSTLKAFVGQILKA